MYHTTMPYVHLVVTTEHAAWQAQASRDRVTRDVYRRRGRYAILTLLAKLGRLTRHVEQAQPAPESV